VLDKVALSRPSSSTSVSFANHSTDFSTLIIIHHPGLVQQVKYFLTYLNPKLKEMHDAFNFFIVKLDAGCLPTT
jgi:hypothetical protein